MEKNKELFEDAEANHWFNRNKNAFENYEKMRSYHYFKLVTFYKKDIKKILEIGCGSGHRLNKICTSLIAEGFGLEPQKQ